MTKQRDTKRPDQDAINQAAIDARRGYTDADLAEVADSPEWTSEDTARSKSFAEMFPEDAAALERAVKKKGRGKQKAPTKQLVSLRLDGDVIERYKADGPGWQVRMGNVLRKAVGL